MGYLSQNRFLEQIKSYIPMLYSTCVGFLMIILTAILISVILKLLILPCIKFLKIFKVRFCSKPNLNYLKEKFGDWAVVTGSTDGIGKEYAKELVKRNINVVLISRSLEKLNRTKDEIQMLNSSVEIKVIQADFTEGPAAINRIKAQLDGITVGILVNNVGLIHEYPMYLGEVSEEELWNIINVNIGATTLMTRLVIEKMKARRKGAIVNLSSASTLMPLPLLSVYSASKMFVTHFTEAIRAEYAQYGVTIQCLSPFYIRTKMVGYSQTISSSDLLSVEPDNYAAQAIETLGKIDSTAGYWLHEIQTLLCLIAPKFLRTQIGFLLNKAGRNEYLKKRI